MGDIGLSLGWKVCQARLKTREVVSYTRLGETRALCLAHMYHSCLAQCVIVLVRFSRETLMYALLYKLLYVIYYKELAQVIWSLVPMICKLETQESTWGSSGPKAIDRLKTQEKSIFPFKSESWKKLMSKFEGCGGGVLFYLKGKIGFFWFYSGFSTDEKRSTHISTCLTQSAYLNVTFFQKHPHRSTPSNFFKLYFI